MNGQWSVEAKPWQETSSFMVPRYVSFYEHLPTNCSGIFGTETTGLNLLGVTTSVQNAVLQGIMPILENTLISLSAVNVFACENTNFFAFVGIFFLCSSSKLTLLEIISPQRRNKTCWLTKLASPMGTCTRKTEQVPTTHRTRKSSRKSAILIVLLCRWSSSEFIYTHVSIITANHSDKVTLTGFRFCLSRYFHKCCFYLSIYLSHYWVRF